MQRTVLSWIMCCLLRNVRIIFIENLKIQVEAYYQNPIVECNREADDLAKILETCYDIVKLVNLIYF